MYYKLPPRNVSSIFPWLTRHPAQTPPQSHPLLDQYSAKSYPLDLPPSPNYVISHQSFYPNFPVPAKNGNSTSRQKTRPESAKAHRSYNPDKHYPPSRQNLPGHFPNARSPYTAVVNDSQDHITLYSVVRSKSPYQTKFLKSDRNSS